MQGDLLNPMKLIAVYVTIATLPNLPPLVASQSTVIPSPYRSQPSRSRPHLVRRRIPQN
jgi:hypothetical protein